MKNKISFYLLYGMLVLLGGLGVLLLIFGQKTPHPSYSENRMLSGFPKLSAETLKDGSFMTGIEDYLSDNMIERDEIVAKTEQILNRFSRKEARDPLAEQEELFQQVEALAGEAEESRTAQPTAAATPEQTASAVPEKATETPAAEPSASETGTPEPADGEKDLSAVPECRFTCIKQNGAEETIYIFPRKNIQRMIRVLNAYRAALPDDGHVFFAQPPFPGVAAFLQNGEYSGWDGALEDTINAFADDGVVAVSVQKILEKPLLNGEDLYFNTDHHWKPRAACYTANACLSAIGIDPKPYEAYAYLTYNDFYGSSASKPGYKSSHEPDTVDIMIPSTPVKGVRIYWNGTEEDAPMITSAHSYMAFLGGTLGPWRRFETGVDCGRHCLVIGDSFANVFLPYLTPYYETVHMTDVRQDYYDAGSARWTISEYIERNGIDDVYIVLSTASGVNTDYLIDSLLKYLGEKK